MKTENRSDRVWLRLIQSYGSRVADTYGEEMPKVWTEAINDLTDEQIAYGLRKCNRDTPIHPPTVGQFVAACVDMPAAKAAFGPTTQERLSAWVMRNRSMQPDQYCRPWTYAYREWIDEEKPKHVQRQSECVGVMVPASANSEGFYVSVADMDQRI